LFGGPCRGRTYGPLIRCIFSQLVIEYDPPQPSIVPAAEEYRYVKSRDEIEAKPLKAAKIRELYQDVVAAVALRTIHEVLEGDQGNHINVVTFSGRSERRAFKGLLVHAPHTAASRRIMAGVDMVTGKEIMGHRDIETTLRYAHLAPDHLKEGVNRGSLFQSSARNELEP
jgi:hypothetical protein